MSSEIAFRGSRCSRGSWETIAIVVTAASAQEKEAVVAGTASVRSIGIATVAAQAQKKQLL